MGWKEVNDPRLGYMNDDGAILRKPTQYADGTFWNSHSSMPTRVQITDNWFVVLQIRKVLDEETRQELVEIINKIDRPVQKRVKSDENKNSVIEQTE